MARSRTSLWSQFYDLELDRRPLKIEQILIYQIGGFLIYLRPVLFFQRQNLN